MRPGVQIGERFVIESEARQGGMSAVFRARDKETGLPVALKLLEKPDEERLARFWREAGVLEALRHPRIPRLLAHGHTEEGQPFFTMDWLDGIDLSDRLRTGPLDRDQALALVRHVADALAVAHEAGIVHRDIKPANLFLVDGDVDRVVVLDFGIARVMSATGVTLLGTTIGTPSYMAPEQAKGVPDIDARADVYSLGAVFYHCLCGQPPFVAQSPLALMAKVVLEDPPPLTELVPEIGSEVERLCLALLAKDRDHRMADGAAARDAAERVAETSRSRPVVAAALTASEQRLVSVIAARPASPASGETTSAPALSRLLAEEARAYGGRVERFADHSVVVVVEAEEDAVDQVTRAASCALAMHGAAPQVPIALATGRAHLREGSLVGEAIDRLTRVLYAPAGEQPFVAVDEMTAGLLGDRFSLRPLDTPELWRLDRAVGEVDDAAARRLPLVGRSDELGQLLAVYDRSVRRRTTNAVMVVAPPGLGKTRLARAFVDRVAGGARGHRWWSVRGDPLRSRVPFSLAAEIVRRGTDAPAGGSPEERRFCLSRAVSVVPPGPDRTRIVEFLAEMTGLGGLAPAGVELRAARHDPFLMNDQIRRAFADWIRATTLDHPLLLVADDLQWCDRKSLELLEELPQALPDRPLMIVGLARAEPIDWTERAAWRDSTIPLGGLDVEAANLLVHLSLELATPAESERMVQRAAGNPRVLEELIRASARGESGSVPATVLALAQARLARQEPWHRRILRAGAVFGVGFRAEGVARLLGDAAGDDVRAGLERLVAEGILATATSAAGAGWEFKSDVDREAAYGMLTEDDRLTGHRLAAGFLAESTSASPLELAEHFDRAGELATSAAHYLLAAEHAMANEDLDAARYAADRATRHGAPADVDLHARARLVLAHAYRWLADYARTDHWGRLAMEGLPVGSANWFLAVGHVTVAAARRSDFAKVDELARIVMAQPALTPFDDTARRVTLGRLAWASLMGGRIDDADAILAALPEGYGDDDDLAAAPHARTLGLRAAASGDLGLAAAHWARAVELFDAVGNQREAAAQRINVGFGLVTLGQYERAGDLLRAAYRDATALRLVSVAAGALQNLGISLSRLGSFAEGCTHLRASIEAFAKQGDRRLEAGSRIYISEALVGAGDLAAALWEAETARRATADLPPMFCVASAAVARVLLADDRDAEALVQSEIAYRVLGEVRSVEEGEALVYGVHARALQALGRTDEAREVALAGRARIEERATKIEDIELRESFTERVADNRELLRLAATLGA